MDNYKKFFTPQRIAAYVLLIVTFLAIIFIAPSEKLAYYDLAEVIEEFGEIPEMYFVEYGIWNLIIIVVMFVFCVLTHSILEGFIWATSLTIFMRFRGDFIPAFMNEQINAVIDWDNARMLLLYILMGSVLAAFSKAGGGAAVANFVKSKAKSSKLALILMIVLDICLSIDDELSAFTTGAAITPINDSYKVPREKSALMIRFSAVAPANLWQLGAWVVFVAVLLEQCGFAESGDGINAYMQCVPFMFFPIIALIMALLVALGIMPNIGKMKDAYKRVEEGGPIAPEGSAANDAAVSGNDFFSGVKKPNAINFFLPLAVLLGVSLMYEFDVLAGIFATILFCFIFFVAEGICTPQEYIDEVFMGGMHNMLMLTVLFGISVCFCAQLDAMGFADYVIGLTQNLISPKLLPFIVFVVFSITEFLCSFNWTLYMMALPIVVPLSQAIGANTVIVIAALICAGNWGSMGCLYSDGALVAAAATDTDVYEASTAALPYMLICCGLSAVAFLVCGFIF